MNLPDEWFDTRPKLAHIRDFARSRRANPTSTLVVALVHTVCFIPPRIVMPPLVGGRVALNIFAALVGDSAGGKGVSEAAGRDVFTFEGAEVDHLPAFSPGSGEGLARTFMELGKESIHTALFKAPEVDTLTKLFERRGNPLEAELRKLCMGEELGFSNANKDTRTKVRELSYRAGLIVGVQPLRAAVLLNGAEGGTPQRFLWASVRDPDMPDERPDPVAPLTITLPDWPLPDPHGPGGPMHVDLWLPAVARDEIDRQQVASHHGDPDCDPLAGHNLLTRAKVAAALMVWEWDDRTAGQQPRVPQVTAEDWSLAGDIISISDAARESCARAASEKARRTRRARAYDAAEHEAIVADSKFEQAKRAILRWLDKLPAGDNMPRSALRRRIKYRLRVEFDPAIAELIDQMQITEVATERGVGYMRYTPYTQGTPHPTSENQGCSKGVPVYRYATHGDTRPGEIPHDGRDPSVPADHPRKASSGDTFGSQKTNSAEAYAEFDGPMCSTGCGRPADPLGWCKPRSEAYGMPYSKPESMRDANPPTTAADDPRGGGGSTS